MLFLETVNHFLWSWLFLPGLLLCGGVLTWRCRGFQLRRFGLSLRLTVGRTLTEQDTEDGVTPLQAASTALASTIGTGNIVGAAQAVTMGGPGALFWLWMAALLGMAVKYAEIYLGLLTRRPDGKGRFLGGPMNYIRAALGPLAAGIYAALAALSALGMGNLAQCNTCVSALTGAVQSFLPLDGNSRFFLRLGLGLALALIATAIIGGGVRGVGRAMERLVPFMALAFLTLTGTVLFRHAGRLPAVLGEVFVGAFRPQAVLGAAGGLALKETIHWGVRRGAFSNEAGLGSAAIAHASARAEDPAEHALWGIFEVFVDTVVLCSATALAILCSGVSIPWGSVPGPELLGAALATVFGGRAAAVLLALCVGLFSFSTVIGCAVYGLRSAEYLLGSTGAALYRGLYLACIPLGSVLSTAAVWTAADAVNALMALPNLAAVLLLSGTVSRAVRRRFFT